MPILAELVGDSPGIAAVRAKLGQLLSHRHDPTRRLPPVLLQGETGTGKGLLARLIHREGPRRNGPFVDVNCAAIPETLLEAELFGFERGAFTDARQSKPGLFQTADGGILFLDELGLLPLPLQPKLLKVIEEQAIRRLGSTRSESVDVWILAASNEALAAAVIARRFREDLYHRLAVLTVSLPPLRERVEDIPTLSEHFLSRACADYGLPSRTLCADAHAALRAYGWPGNVRELSNVLERAALLADAEVITGAALGLISTTATEPPATGPPAIATRADFDDAVSSVERQRALDALRETNWNVTQAATRLGISRARLRYRIEKHRLQTGGPSRRSRARDRQPSVAAFASATLSNGALTPASPLRWDLRQVALLRADLVFESGDNVPPDTSRQLALLIDKIQSFGGRVQELGSRTIVAVFGLELVEDAPSRAALAALAIQIAVTRARALDSAGAGIRLAVHVARSMVGQMSGYLQMDLDTMHDAATTLKALIALGETDTIVVSEASIPFLERRFEFIGGFRLARREPTGFDLGGRPLSRYVGHDRELQILTDQLAHVERGHGQIVGALGEPGVGKSRLVYEFTRSIRLRPWRTLACRAVSYGKNTPYLPFVDLLKQYFHINDVEAPNHVRERVTARILKLDASFEAHLPALVSLLDPGAGDPRWESLEPLQRRDQTLDAIKSLLIRESGEQPLCVVFEDLHWVDSESEVVIEQLVESLRSARILLVVTFRPEYQPGWRSETHYTQLPIAPLEPHRTEELLRALMGGRVDLSPLKRLLIERTGGNPFFVEESVRGLVENQALVGERGAYRLGKSADTIHAQATVHVVPAARMDQLPTQETTLLQTASVIGADLPFALLFAIADMPENMLRQRLQHLRAAEFLYERSASADLIYTFKHALTQEVAYDSLPQERRCGIHIRIVEAIERLYADRVAEQVELLAHHSLKGERWEKAFAYLRQAGVKAARRSANREAVAHFEQALSVLEHLPESRDRTEQALDVQCQLQPAFLGLAEYGRMPSHLRDAEVLSQTLGDRRRLGLVLGYQSIYFGWMGDLTAALDAGHRALALATDLGDVGLQAVRKTQLAQFYQAGGNYVQARALFMEALDHLGGDLLFERFDQAPFPAAAARARLAWCLARLGQFADAVVYGSEGVRIAEAADHAFSLVVACLGFGSVYLLKGDLPEAIRVLDRGVGPPRGRRFPAA